ncbi:MAG TPA: hypothetical protein VFR34_14925, partial [Paracoccaceae bacterium]|nr:hypothetical protein [Paracoccaceae bacterium]
RGRIRAASPTLFVSEHALLVLRHDARAPARLSRSRLVYFIDDAWAAAWRDRSLSRFWRLKATAIEARAARFYLARASDIVVSTEALRPAAEAAAPGRPVHVIGPYWSEPIADLAHFDAPGLDIAFLGAQLHADDLAFLLPVLPRLLEALPEATFTLSAGHRLPPPLAAHPRVRRLAGLRWPDYRAGLAARRFHLALYPLRATPFNAGRSVNKIIEHAVVGAAGLYSEGWPPGQAAAAAGAGLALPWDAGAWAEAILRLAADRTALRAFAAAGREHAGALNRPEPQRALWTRLMLAPAT